jgi:hypothetical protein
MKALKILKEFDNIKDAVEYAEIDLSYNRAEAMKWIARSETQATYKIKRVFVVSDPQNAMAKAVYYTLQCDILLLNRYNPYGATITSDPFTFGSIKGDQIEFDNHGLKGIGDRKLVAKIQSHYPEVFVTKESI